MSRTAAIQELADLLARFEAAVREHEQATNGVLLSRNTSELAVAVEKVRNDILVDFTRRAP